MKYINYYLKLSGVFSCELIERISVITSNSTFTFNLVDGENETTIFGGMAIKIRLTVNKKKHIRLLDYVAKNYTIILII